MCDCSSTSCVAMQVARVILFVYFFAHMYLHFDQVIRESKIVYPVVDSK